MAASGWYRDPTGQADGRYWDGERWSDQADRRGVTVSSPIDPAHANTPPVAGSDYVAQRAPEPASQTVSVQPAKSSVLGPVFGAIAVVVAIVALVIALSNNSDDGDENPSTPTSDAPAVTEAPAE
jgi:hypothetical protein